MGRTNPTYRDHLRRFRERYGSFRRALRREYQADFDRLFERADAHAHAAGYQNATDPETAALVSMLLAHEVELRELRERLAALDSSGDSAADAGDHPSDAGDHPSDAGDPTADAGEAARDGGAD
ncbi:hypothetical protein [Haloarchaeobius sp. TZWWS8]|uniref:hypothetical protein n=1 Tax=Haloarchaeobius sp. TZWWS8 TaxID=3446121 RepID=UPI003EBE542E